MLVGFPALQQDDRIDNIHVRLELVFARFQVFDPALQAGVNDEGQCCRRSHRLNEFRGHALDMRAGSDIDQLLGG